MTENKHASVEKARAGLFLKCKKCGGTTFLVKVTQTSQFLLTDDFICVACNTTHDFDLDNR